MAENKAVPAGAVATPIIAAVTAAAVAAKEKEHAKMQEKEKEWEVESAQQDAALKKSLPPVKDGEVGRLEYLVQLSLRTTEAWVRPRPQVLAPGAAPGAAVGVWALPLHKQFAANWDRKAKGLQVVETLIPVSTLTLHNPFHRIVSHGFDFSAAGFGRFNVGTVDISGAGGKRGGIVPMEFLVCRIIVGRPYPLSAASLHELIRDNSAKQQKVVPQIPKGYHSIFIQKNASADDDDRKDAKAAGAAGAGGLMGGKYDSKLPKQRDLQPGAGDDGVMSYCHEFLLTDPAAVLPVYLIRAEVDTAAVNKREPKCEQCDQRDATVYCEQDDVVLCSECDLAVHSVNRIVARHSRVPMQQRLLKENGHCPEHPQKKVEFYCNTCATPVCVWCKMIGNHSGGDAVHHKLTEIFMAYNQARNDSTAPDAAMEQRKQHIRAQMELIDAKMKAVNENSTAIEQQLFAMLQEVLYRLQEYHQRKLNILVGESLEFGRQLEEMAWSESFLRYQQHNADPVNFLKSWQRHLQLRARLSANPLPTTVAVQPDIRIAGKVDVATASDDSFLQFLSSAASMVAAAQQSVLSPSKRTPAKENVQPPVLPQQQAAALSQFVEANSSASASAKLKGHKRTQRKLSQMPDEELMLREIALQSADGHAHGHAH